MKLVRATLAGIPEAVVMLAGAALAILLLTWRWPLPVEIGLPSRFLFVRGAILDTNRLNLGRVLHTNQR